ncbi:Protein of unknown function [Cotesia congregata]|uniref:Uncharacterized protein n=1 Tax=Cotesia congregata TaxID=51543 RepID=A0A8J2MK32_COTCN|nr:Protein of unknown function [Cotesia congregata]
MKEFFKLTFNMSDNNSDIEGPSQYAVVCFLPRRGSGYDEIDLVPYSWLDTIDEKVYCYYPNTKKNLKKREKYLEKNSLPKKSWILCEVEIISSTDTLEKGKRHLLRAETTINVNTDDPGRATSPTVQQLSSAGISRELDDIEGMNLVLSRNDPKNLASGTSQVLNDYLNDTDSVSSSLFENNNLSRAALNNKSEKLKNGSKRLPEINANMIYDGACSNCGLSKEYIEFKFTEISKKLDKMKFSLLYEVQKQGGNIKTQVIMNSASNDENEKSNLKNLFEVLTYGEKDVNTCVRKTLSEVITTKVQQFYSGAGRMICGEGKLNFSATKTYVCLSVGRYPWPRLNYYDRPILGSYNRIILVYYDRPILGYCPRLMLDNYSRLMLGYYPRPMLNRQSRADVNIRCSVSLAPIQILILNRCSRIKQLS